MQIFGPEFLFLIYKCWETPDFLHEVVPRSVFYQRTLVFTLCWKLNHRARFLVISSEQVFFNYNHILPTCTAVHGLSAFWDI